MCSKQRGFLTGKKYLHKGSRNKRQKWSKRSKRSKFLIKKEYKSTVLPQGVHSITLSFFDFMKQEYMFRCKKQEKTAQLHSF